MMTNGVFQSASPEEWSRNAVVGGQWTSEYTYAWGYKLAGDELVKCALESHQNDLLFYPICFLYRHSLEVALKELVRETEHLIRLGVRGESLAPHEQRDSGRVKKQLERSHRLDFLLNWLGARLDMVGGGRLPEGVRAVVMEMHETDPSGQRFRYAHVRGVPECRSFSTQESFDLERVAAAVGDALDYLLGGVAGWLSNQIDAAKIQLGDVEDFRDEWPVFF